MIFHVGRQEFYLKKIKTKITKSEGYLSLFSETLVFLLQMLNFMLHFCIGFTESREQDSHVIRTD